MKPISAGHLDKLHALRREFDASFAQPMAQDTTALIKLLIVQAGEGHFVLRLDDALGLHACPRIIALPGAGPGLLGLAGIRGQLIAVYRLSAILGVQSNVDTPPRWLLLPRAAGQLALGLDGIAAYVNAPVSALCPATASSSIAPELCPHVLNYPQQGSPLPVLDIHAVVAAIAQDAAAQLSSKES